MAHVFLFLFFSTFLCAHKCKELNGCDSVICLFGAFIVPLEAQCFWCASQIEIWGFRRDPELSWRNATICEDVSKRYNKCFREAYKRIVLQMYRVKDIYGKFLALGKYKGLSSLSVCRDCLYQSVCVCFEGATL